MEYRIALRAVPSHDFGEGVRALLIDKDGRARWNPSSLAGVSEPPIPSLTAGERVRYLALPPLPPRMNATSRSALPMISRTCATLSGCEHDPSAFRSGSRSATATRPDR